MYTQSPIFCLCVCWSKTDKSSSLPSLYDDIAESVTAVAGRCGPAHVYYEDELVFICPFHKDAHKENVPRAEHHLPLPVWLAVRGVFI